MAPHPELTAEEAALSPMAVRDLSIAKTIVKRADDAYKQLAAAGARDPTNLKGPGFQVLFALIAVGMTLMALWFFFWAKNGGFKWRGKEDWEDYKSTVLRRKGPDGKTLSNATKSTRLGGGSVVHGGSYGAPTSIGYTDETGTSADINEYRDAEEGKGGLRGGDGRTRKEKKGRHENTNDYNDPELRNYRHEKAARVGGLNRQADGMYTDYSGSQPSELGSNVSSAPLVKKPTTKDPKKEAKDKERRAKERMRKAKAAEKEAARVAAAEAKARREEQKAAIKREKEAYKKAKKTKSEMAPSEAPEMAEVTRPLTEYTGAYTEYTAPSDAGTPEKSNQKQVARRAPPSAAYSFTTGDDTNTVYSGAYTDNHDARTEARTAPSVAQSNDIESSYYSDYRPNADPSVYASRAAKQDRATRSASRPRGERPQGERPQGARSRPQSSTRSGSQSPQKRNRTSQSARPSRSQYTAAPSDIFTATNGDAHGHMSYPCHIPGLSSAGSVGVSESVSQVGAPSARSRGGRDVMDGYRRGGVRAVGRRDSLSDSD
ncbi:hypothetical protein FB567DRAFT_536451 [Paraphoma chrysanthemicola]|uniref:Uncharacterized protein n=1 Tax=Paraphoma chrysanthemicola TaxID=798071 RepID=A0A8K0QXG6_9PLEO|nr:hypothetical protein FB567DRAFT_536451 [Paraphoma chrysanthemicola]